MKSIENSCLCACGLRDFEVRINLDGPVGLLTCPAGHHSLLLDSREYWADLLQDGWPKVSKCRCGGRLFRVDIQYEFRASGDVCAVYIKPTCSDCGKPQVPVSIDIKYSPTDELISRPLDPIDEPWLQPKRRQITAFWRPADAQKFACYLVQSLGARVFSRQRPLEFVETNLGGIEFNPELKQDLLFTNIKESVVPMEREPEKVAPFPSLDRPTHMMLRADPDGDGLMENRLLLHYVKYSDEVLQAGSIEKQPAVFREFARMVLEWLVRNYVSVRGRNTADNPSEYGRIKVHPKQRR